MYTSQREWGVLLDKPAGKERMEGILKTELYPGGYQSPIAPTDEHPPVSYGTWRISVVDPESFIPDPDPMLTR